MLDKDGPSTLQRYIPENSGGHGRRRDGGERGACAAGCLRRGPELVFRRRCSICCVASKCAPFCNPSKAKHSTEPLNPIGPVPEPHFRAKP